MTCIIQYEIAGAKLSRQSGDMTKVPLSKDELERQKLELEIRELQRKWWQRPVYLSVLLPMVLASLTVLAGILSGYFNRERVELQRDINALKSEKAALIETKLALEKQAEETSQGLDKIEQSLKEMTTIVQESQSPASPTPSN